jgi:DNA-binding transcriptional regulator PaaX
MNNRTEEFLNFLLWSAEMFSRPTFRNLTGSYEEWAYHNGLMRQAVRLERKGLIESDRAASKDRLYRLTANGHLHVLGGRDPEAKWARPWDGQWRIFLFDVPMSQNAYRARLRRFLHIKGYGCLQKSVWVSPDDMEEQKEILREGEINVESLLLLTARPSAGETDDEIVAGAWDFEKINRGYERYLEILKQKPAGAVADEGTAKALLRWANSERESWLESVGRDPLLPERLLPKNYLGQKAWRERHEVLRKAGRQLQTFT